jgi:ribosome-associated protein
MHDEFTPSSDEEEYDNQPSKTRRKQEMHALQALGEQMVELNNDRLRQLDLPESLLIAVTEARRITARGARQRQMQYIGKLMRDVDPAPIQAKFDEWNGLNKEQIAKFHLIERWRDRLLADDQAISELAREYAAADIQKIRTLIRNAHKEQAAGQPPKSSHALFRELRGVVENTR